MNQKHNFRDRHHLIPKQRQKEQQIKDVYKKDEFHKTLWMWRFKHLLWHALFGNQTLDEIIETLQRIKRIKNLERR